MSGQGAEYSRTEHMGAHWDRRRRVVGDHAPETQMNAFNAANHRMDTDGDTLPDHVEDANGNGITRAERSRCGLTTER